MNTIFKRTFIALLCTLLTFTNAQAESGDYNKETMGEIVVHCETASWGQGSPFNSQCWTSYGGSIQAKTGCVPTAHAIVMHYHKWPEVGTSSRLYNCQAPTYVEITDRTYDWNSMPLVYDSNATEYQKSEVAKAMSHIGHALMTTYGSGASTTNEESSTDKIHKHFNYNLTYASYQANFTQEEWEAKIKESLDNDCPIIYAANNSGTGDSRHMFVIDGYTQNGYYHFNFGWNGNGNGWFKLNNITPYQGDNYSWNGNSQHYAVFNLTPNKSKYPASASVSPAGAGTVSINGGTAGETVSGEYIDGSALNLVATANNGYTFSHWSKNGTTLSEENTYTAKVTPQSNDYVANFYTISANRINIPVNYNSNEGTVTYNGNPVPGTGITPNEYAEVTLTAAANDGYMFTGWEIVNGTESTKSTEKSITFIAKSGIIVNVNFALAGGEYKINKDNITIGGSSYNNNCSVWKYSKEGDIEDILTLSTASGTTEVNALSKTSNRLYAHAYDKNGNGFREITYTLTAKEGFVITGYSLTYVVGSTYKGEITVRNATSEPQTPNNTDPHTLSYQYANAARSTAYGTRTAEFTLSSTTAHNTQYITIKEFTVTVLSEGGGATYIKEIEHEEFKEAIYDLQGRKLSEITKPGMYIINGKKVYKK